MSNSALATLLQNAALLLALAATFDLATSRQPWGGRFLRQLILGLLVGTIGIGLITTSFQLEPGIISDTRSVLLSIGGLFLGGIPTVVAVLMCGAFRLWQGGLAAWVGIAVILTSGSIGLVWRRYRRHHLAEVSWRELYALGVVVHVVMLALMMLLPAESGPGVLREISLPVMLLYPVATTALGLLLVNRLRRNQGVTALAESMRLLDMAGALARFGGWSVNLAQERVVWSDAVAAIHDMPPGSSPTITEGIAFYAPECRDRITERFTACARDGLPYDEELEIITRSGRRVWVRALGAAVRTAEGRITGVHGAFQDITERHRMEEEMRDSERRFRNLFEASPHPMWVYDLGTLRFLAVNNTAVHRYGYTREEFLSMTLEAIRPSEDVPRLRENIATHTEMVQQSGPWRHRKRNGEIIVVEIASHGLEWDGHSARLVHALDVTESHASRARVEAARRALLSALEDQRETAAKVRQLNLELEHRVRERTVQLEVANRELESFSYSVSHDLRAPLRAINGFARILAEDYSPQLDSEGRRVLSVIRDESIRMGQLIDELLQFSRLGRQPLRLAKVDMAALARSVFAQLQTTYPERKIAFHLQTLPEASGDPALLRQVWSNLLDNAIKYTRDRPDTRIEVTGTENSGELVYSVQDNGAGFDMRYVDKLFGVFQRLHNADQFEGTGVGLALVQRLIQRHGGRVWAEGTPGQGAAFHFTLPRASEKVTTVGTRAG